jgi:hypothetical protein
MNYLQSYIILIIIIKVIFIILAISKIYVEKIKKDEKTGKKIKFWKERIEFIFIILMSILLIYIFNPRTNNINLINKEIQLLLYLFGFILLITAKWNIFIKESIIFKYLQISLGNEGSN